ncbi:hypothetical protein [Streptomyces cyslabdanicus]|uniref:hypothetical protein n=1 Tax=Streptomyces cyslabdanicus TaxID=1470456 RepID=UPI004043FFBC
MGPQSFTPVSASNSFWRYVGLDRPCWIDVERVAFESGSTVTVEVVGRQDGHNVFSSTLTGRVD